MMFGGFRRKAAYSLTITILLIGVLVSAVKIQPVKTEGSIDLLENAPASQGVSPLSEGPPIQWNKTYGGAGSEYAYSVVQTSDGGYAVVGATTESVHLGYDILLVKTDANGNMQWSKTYGGYKDGDDIAWSVVQTSDGGYAIAGHAQSFGDDTIYCWLIKTDVSGNMQWSLLYTDSEERSYYAQSVVQTGDGEYAVAGYISSFEDIFLIKVNSTGYLQWVKIYGGAGLVSAHSVVQTNDGGYAIAGMTSSYGAGGDDFWLVKTDMYGNLQWSKTYGGTGHDWGYSVVQTSDGGYAIAGWTDSYGAGGQDFWLVKTDAYGNLQWSKTYGRGGYERATSVVQTNDGGYAIAGYDFYEGIRYQGWLFKTYSNGTMQWNKTINGPNYDYVWSVVQTNDGGYAIAGGTNSYGAGEHDFWLVKVAPEIQYTLTITTSSGGTTNPAPGTYTYWAGTQVSVTAIANTGYIFDHWELDGINIGSANPVTVTMDSNHNLKAYFAQIPYDVTIKAHCNTEGVDVSVSITMDGNPTGYYTPHTFTGLTGTHTFTVPNTDPSGHPFKQWSTGSTNPTITVTAGGTYTAYYQAAPTYYTLTISASTGGTTNPWPGTYTYQAGTVVSVTAIPSTNYVFDHWELDGAPYGTSNPTTVTMNANHYLHAVFTPGVGGYVIPVDKIGLLAPYIGLASTTIIALTATIIYVKRFKHKKQKQ